VVPLAYVGQTMTLRYALRNNPPTDPIPKNASEETEAVSVVLLFAT